MADKKPAKTEELSIEQQISAKKADLMELRKSNASGELVNPRAITVARKDVARLLTKRNAEKEQK